MTEDHLPECPTDWCICSYLRACEARVLSEPTPENDLMIHDAKVRAAVLDAAREAVLGAKAVDVAYGRGLDEPAQFIWMNNALAAIDALKEKQ